MEKLTLRKAVELAVVTEQLGAEFYARMERKFSDDKELKEVFAQLVKDEKVHEAQFRKIANEVPQDPPDKQQHELYQYLRATAISEHFRKDYFQNTDTISSKTDALTRALSFEKSTLQYYQAMRDIIGAGTELDKIIDAEKKHVTAVMRLLMSDGKFTSMNDPWAREEA